MFTLKSVTVSSWVLKISNIFTSVSVFPSAIAVAGWQNDKRFCACMAHIAWGPKARIDEDHMSTLTLVNDALSYGNHDEML